MAGAHQTLRRPARIRVHERVRKRSNVRRLRRLNSSVSGLVRNADRRRQQGVVPAGRDFVSAIALNPDRSDIHATKLVAQRAALR
jgi:hypothetical protein